MTTEAKRYLITLLVLMGLALNLFSPIGAHASSNVTGALYLGTIEVTNNSTDTTLTSTNLTLNTQALINTSILNSGANNTAILTNGGADAAFQPSVNTTYPWCFWVPSIGAYTTLGYSLYAGDNITGGKIRWFPGPAGMITADSPTLEPSANFTQEHKGYFDVSASAVGANIAKKPQAIRTFVGSTGNITSTIYATDNFSTDTWTDTGAKIRVNGGRLEYESERSATNDRSYKDTGGIQSNTLWELDWTWYPTSSNNASGAGAALVYLGLFDNTTNPNGYATNFLSFKGTLLASGQYYAYIQTCNASVQTQSTTITYTPATTYYVSLRRESAILASLSIYSDKARATHIAGSPITFAIPATIVNLRYLQCSNLNDNLGAAIEAIGWIDDLSPSWTRPTVSATGLSSGEKTVSSGVPWWQTGNTLGFDGTLSNNSYVDCGVIYNSSARLWIVLRFKLTSAWPDGIGTKYIFGKRSGGGDYLFIRMLADGRIEAAANVGGVGNISLFTTQAAWNANQWYSLLVSVSNVEGMRFRSQTETLSNAACLYTAPAAGNFIIGQCNGGAADSPGITGNIMNVVTGTDLLTVAEETSLLNGLAPADATDYWFIDTGVGDTITSYGTTPNNGTKAAGTTWGTSTYTTGQTGRLYELGMRVDTTDTYIRQIFGASVPDNSNNITDCESAAMPYVESVKRWVNGVLQQHVYWEHNTVFSDYSGATPLHPATPSFRTTSSDADVSAVLSSFVPISTAEATSTTAVSDNLVTPAPTEPTNMYLITGPNPTWFIAPTINTLLDAFNIPRQIIWYPMMMTFCFLFGWLAYKMSRSIFIKAVLVGTFLFFGWVSGVYGGWVMVFYICEMFGVLVMARNYGW
jgi:hypothetical protein